MLRAAKLAVLGSLIAVGTAGCRGNLDPDMAVLIRWLMLIGFAIAVILLLVAIFVRQSDQRVTALVGAGLVAVVALIFLFIMVA